MSRKALFGWIVGALVAVTAVAVAATISVYLSSQFGGGTSNTTNPCDLSISYSFGAPTYSQAASAYTFTTVDYDGLNVTACDTQTLRLTVVDASSVALGNASLLVDDTSPNQSPGSVTPPNGTLTLSQPVSVTAADRIVTAITSN